MSSSRVVIVTGGSQGLGFAIAQRFAQAGNKVVITARNEEKLISATEKLHQYSTDIAWFVADATDAQARKDSLSFAIEKFGSLDVLVNNSGAATALGPLASVPLEDIQNCFNINVFAGLGYALEAYNMWMKKHGGVITNVASFSGLHKASNYYAAYAASKAATIKLTEELGYEFGGKVVINAVAPGFVPTHIVDPQLLEGTQLGYAAQRLGTPEDVAHAVYYLASPEAAWTTGTCLTIGHHITTWPPKTS